MKANRFILMLLVMLVSVTGAWADCTFTYYLPKDVDNSSMVSSFEQLGEVKSHKYTITTGVGEVTFSGTVTSIPKWAFYKTDLLKIVIPEGVTDIDSYSFGSCTKMEYVTLPSTLASIGENAFVDCHSIKYFNLPDNVTSIGASAFYRCSSIQEFVIPAGVTSIQASTFWGCSNLTSVTIPDGVTSIGSYAFYQCTKLKNINLPDNIEVLEKSTFEECESLGSIKLPANLLTIKDRAFARCTALSSITIPKNVASIEQSAFLNCHALRLIICLNPVPPTCVDGCFYSNLDYNVTVQVPYFGLDAYKEAVEWEKFGNNIVGVFTDNVSTGIKNANENPLTDSEQAQSIYSLQGVRLNSLHKGINIVGGKKVMR